jgi:hypothetical protein
MHHLNPINRRNILLEPTTTCPVTRWTLPLPIFLFSLVQYYAIPSQFSTRLLHLSALIVLEDLMSMFMAKEDILFRRKKCDIGHAVRRGLITEKCGDNLTWRHRRRNTWRSRHSIWEAQYSEHADISVE